MYAYAHLVTYSIFFEIHHNITLPDTILYLEILEICWSIEARSESVTRLVIILNIGIKIFLKKIHRMVSRTAVISFTILGRSERYR